MTFLNQNLTDGRIGRSLLLLSLPMILGNMLQQLYNIADTLIVGKTIGAAALSAVGSSYTLMVLLTSVVLGLCMGSGVVFAQLYGAGKLEELKTSIFNSFVFVLIITAVINVLSFALLDKFIVWLNIPAEAAEMTLEYLRIIFTGLGFVYIYNFFASVLRSIGNTLAPLIFLAVSAVINIVLDIVFIVLFDMGVGGAAWATVAAQALSALSIAIYFFAGSKELCPERRHMKYHRALLKAVIENSALTAVQQSIMNLGILMVQGLVNSFGFFVSAAFTVVVKIDAFAYMPAQDFGNAFSTFVSQNYGAKKPDRIFSGLKTAAVMTSLFCALSSAAVFIFAEPLMRRFVGSGEREIIEIGVKYLRIEGSFYIGIGILFLWYALFRGLGRSAVSIVLTVVSLGSRVALAYILSGVPAIGVSGIWWAIPIGWFLADALGFLFLCRLKRDYADKSDEAETQAVRDYS